VVHWGVSTDVPAPGDYNGDGMIDIAVYRTETGAWWVHGNSPITWGGQGSDKPLPSMPWMY